MADTVTTNNWPSVMTDAGNEALATAVASGTPVKVAAVAVGDGGGAIYDPTTDQTALRGETYRAAPNSLSKDPNNPNWIICELVIPADVGGWYVREAGVFDDAGTLLCVAKVPESLKAALTDGTPYQMVIEVVMMVISADAVDLTIDTSTVLASVTYVNNVAGALTQEITNVEESSTIAVQIPGGKTTQVLAKKTNEDGDVVWINEMNPRVYFRGQF